MADTYTTNIRTVKQQIGGNNNSWGTILNTNFDTIDAKFGATTSISTTGGNTTLTESQEVVGMIDVSGALVANAVLIFSGRGGFWIVQNRTTGSYTVTCKVSGQTGVTIDSNGAALVWCNGTDIKLGNPPPAAVAEATVASATTTDVLGSASEFVAISGTTTITSFGTGATRKRFCRATGAFKVTHDATTLICPGGQDITTEAGDTFIVVADASSNVRIVAYQRAGVPPSYLPIGFVGDYAGSTAPAFWLLCYGQAVSRSTYAKLYAAIGTTFGSGNGVTTFNLPDARGRVTAGVDNMGGSSANRLVGAATGSVTSGGLGATGGEETHQLKSAETGQKAISAAPVTISDPGHTHSPSGANIAGNGSAFDVSVGGSTGRITAIAGFTLTTALTGISASLTVSGSDASSVHNNVQPTLVLNKIIFTGV